MGNPKGFLEIDRQTGGYRPVNERINDYSEVEVALNENDRKKQASRCMDCGIPFCSWGCPIMNNMPEFQDAIYNGDWKLAVEILHQTNNFPEFTGKICPAPCEHACVLNIDETPVSIRENESSVAEKGFELGYIVPKPPKRRTGKTVAVIGSGPAGLACADLLNKWGHTVTVFERDAHVGGLLRYGIPDFKLNKKTIERRIKLLEEEGLQFKTKTNVGEDVRGKDLLKDFDAVVLAIGAMQPRNLEVEGRELKGVHYAMEFLTQQNKEISKESISEERISATGKHVVVIGGGDTGSDCVGTSIRQKAKSITQIEILPKPSEKRELNNPWPYYANTLRTSSSHLEGCERRWSLNSKRVIGENGEAKKLEIVEVEWVKENGKYKMIEKPDTVEQIDADLVLLSMGFVHCIHEGLADEFKLKYDMRGNIVVDENGATSQKKVFAAGDAVSGASLVVRAIASGRKLAENVDAFLNK
jgi:glutamate synthase (NADPH/NADH) small chain